MKKNNALTGFTNLTLYLFQNWRGEAELFYVLLVLNFAHFKTIFVELGKMLFNVQEVKQKDCWRYPAHTL